MIRAVATALLILTACPAGAAQPSSREDVMSNIDLLTDTKAPVEKRIAAARALGEAGDPKALGALAISVEATHEGLRDASKESLRKLGAGDFFAGQLASSSSAQERQTAAKVLRHLKDPKTIPALARGLADADPAVRRACAHALAVFGAPKAMPELTRALSDESSDVRYFAAIALAGIKTPEARSALESRLGAETDATVKGEIEKGLR